MKTFIVSALIVLSTQASVACLGEAQIIAEVSGVAQTERGTCAVSISAPSVTSYRENGTCPLSLEEVLQSPVEVKAKANGACGIHPGGQISGVLVLGADGIITLE